MQCIFYDTLEFTSDKDCGCSDGDEVLTGY